jgi:two-component system sensor histidine kinase EvgS
MFTLTPSISLTNSAALTAGSAVREPPNTFEPKTNQTPQRVMFVGIGPRLRAPLLKQVTAFDAEALMVPDGPTALDALAARTPALILMACDMPGMDGCQTTRRIRRREAERGVPRLPIIGLCTAPGMAPYQRSLRSGMNYVIRQPLYARELLAMLMLWLALPEAAAQDWAGLKLSYADPRPFYLSGLAEEIGAFERAMTRRQYWRMVHHAHRGKGAAQFLRAEAVADWADRLEQMASRGSRQEVVHVEEVFAAWKEAAAAYFM